MTKYDVEFKMTIDHYNHLRIKKIRLTTFNLEIK